MGWQLMLLTECHFHSGRQRLSRCPRTHTHTDSPPVTGLGTREKGNKDGRRQGEGKNVKGGEHVSAFVHLPHALVFTIRYTERKEKLDSFIIFPFVHPFSLSIIGLPFFLRGSPSILFSVQKTAICTGLKALI